MSTDNGRLSPISDHSLQRALSKKTTPNICIDIEISRQHTSTEQKPKDPEEEDLATIEEAEPNAEEAEKLKAEGNELFSQRMHFFSYRS